MAKYTKSNIQQLADEMRHAKDARPFALLTGAGCSKSAGIPLAFELIKEINDPANPFHIHLDRLDEEQRKDYGQCMRKLPKNARKDLLQTYLDNAKINWAHIAIASMMKAGYFQRVLTFNFDNVLSRACGLCGEYPAIYDFVTGVSASTDHLSDPCIIHLHGQGTGLAMLNTDDETKKHADRMIPLLRDTLDKSPLVILGYSGDSDKVFEKLSDLYDGREKLHWCDYHEEPASHVSTLLNKHQDLTNHYGKVDADLFLVQLAQELGCFPPAVFDKPLDHLRQEIKDVCEFPSSAESTVNVLKNLNIKLDNYENTLATNDQDVKTQQAIDATQQLLLEGRYNKIVAQENAETGSVPTELLASAMFSQALEQQEDLLKNYDFSKYADLFKLYQNIINIKKENHGAYNNWGTALSELGKQTGERQWLEEAVEKYKAAIEIKADDYDAYNNWGVTLLELGKQTGERQWLEEAVEKYKAAIEIKADNYDAYNYWGVALKELGKQTGERQWLEEAAEKYKAAIEIKADNHGAYNNWGITLSELGKQTGERQWFEEAVEKYKAAIEIKADYYDVYNNWGITLKILGVQTSERQWLEEAVEKYKAAIVIKADNYEAYNNWGIALSELGKQTGERQWFEEAVEKYKAAIEIKADKHDVYCNWGITLSELSEQTGERQWLEEAVEKYKTAIEIKTDKHDAYNNLIGSMLTLWRATKSDELLEEAKVLVDKALKIKPDNAYNAACLASITKDEALCKKHLNTCLNAGTLPDKKHLKTDSDLDNMRDKAWFVGFLAELD